MLRVLVLSSQLPVGDGSQTMAPLVRQMESLRAIGVEVTGVEVTGLPKLKYLQTIPRLRRAAKRVDLIHAHFGYCGWLAETCHSKPVIVSFMGDDLLGTPDAEGQLRTLSRVVVRANQHLAGIVDAVIVKSAEMARVVAPITAHIIPNGVDLEAFAPMNRYEARKKLGWSLDKRYVLFPGNPDLARKCYPLSEAAVRVASRLLDDQIDLAVLWNVPSSQVPLYMNASDAMLMTSFVEGSPNVVKEAMACDLPVISVPVGDTVELLDGATGYFVRQRDAEELGGALAELFQGNPPIQGRQALQRKGLDLAGVARRILSVYESVLRGKRA